MRGLKEDFLSQCAYAPSHTYILSFHMCECTANCYRRSKTIQAQDASEHFIARYISMDLRTWNEREQESRDSIGLLYPSILSRDVFKVNFVRTFRS